MNDDTQATSAGILYAKIGQSIKRKAQVKAAIEGMNLTEYVVSLIERDTESLPSNLIAAA